MKHILTPLTLISIFALSACGGDSSDGGSIDVNGSVSSPPSFSVSTTNVVLSGKQFEGMPPRERIQYTFDSDEISIVSAQIAGDARTPSSPDFRVPEGERIFRTESDSSGTFVDVVTVFSDVEGGTYTDVLTLEPQLRAGGSLPTVQVNLTLIQEPTAPITAALNDPSVFSYEIVEGGPAIRIPATVTTGNTIRWSAQPFAFTADDGLVVLTSDPAEGTGTEQIDLVLTPTPSLIDSLRQTDVEFAIMSFQDIDHPGNFTEIGVDVTLGEN